MAIYLPEIKLIDPIITISKEPDNSLRVLRDQKGLRIFLKKRRIRRKISISISGRLSIMYVMAVSSSKRRRRKRTFQPK